MIKKNIFLGLISSISVLIAFNAYADNGIEPLILSGNWIGFSHAHELTTDMCMASAVSPEASLMLRADNNLLEVRTANAAWNLAPDTKGEMTITVGKYSHKFDLITFNGNALTSVVGIKELQDLLTALSKGNTATLTYGSKTTRHVSLMGAGKVLNVFRGCVHGAGIANLGAPEGVKSPF